MLRINFVVFLSFLLNSFLPVSAQIIVDNIEQKGMNFFTPPYKAPGGDACADAAVKKLCEFAR